MSSSYRQIDWDDDVAAACRRLVELAIGEDFGPQHLDCTKEALFDGRAQGQARLVARRPGVVAGLQAAEMAFDEINRRVTWTGGVVDGARVAAEQSLATIIGPALSMLSGERIALNFLGRLSGIATLTTEYVAAVRGTRAKICDTRKTTPGWRLLEKYAVHCGGGENHRLGLYDAMLIKDNHLAHGDSLQTTWRFTPAQAVHKAKQFVAENPDSAFFGSPIEVEVDTLAQLEEVLPAGPDIVLLDNMTLDQLRQAVRRRDAVAPGVALEASGGVNLQTVAAIAQTGVERISVGALTHSAPWLDIGLDWIAE